MHKLDLLSKAEDGAILRTSHGLLIFDLLGFIDMICGDRLPFPPNSFLVPCIVVEAIPHHTALTTPSDVHFMLVFVTSSFLFAPPEPTAVVLGAM